MMSRNWTFERKLAAGYVVIVALVVVMGFTAAHVLRAVVVSKDRVMAVNGENLLDAERLRMAASRRVVGVRGYLLGKDETDLEEIRVQAGEFQSALARLRSRAASPDEARSLERVERAAIEHFAASEHMVGLHKAGTPTAEVIRSRSTSSARSSSGIATKPASARAALHPSPSGWSSAWREWRCCLPSSSPSC
jgi:CHASE3 domain sensor protein